jgi:hypothetical protein
MNKHNFRISRTASLPLIALGFLVSLGALISPAQAEVSCHLINAKAVGQDHGGGATTGSVIGGGLLHGTIAGSITGTGLVGTVASFVETVTFTTQHGTLTVMVTGAIDITTGQFNASGPVTAATGKLSGASGNIALSGVVNFATGVFSEDISGAVCVNLAP